MAIFKGACPALITPFTEDGVNFDTLEQLLDFQLTNGSDAILVCGTTGEPATMTTEEKHSVVEFARKKIRNKVPLIVSTGSNNTLACINESRFAEQAGADALLIVTPYYNKATQNGLIAHYTAIADSVGIPIILYNVPSRTGVNLLPETVARLAEHKNIRAIKEASGNIDQVCELARLTRGGMDIYSGEDGITLPILSLGGIGVISVVSNVHPQLMHDLTVEKDPVRAAELQFAVKELANELFREVNPIPAKTACNLMGFDCGPLRLPLTEMEEQNKTQLIAVLKKYGILR